MLHWCFFYPITDDLGYEVKMQQNLVFLIFSTICHIPGQLGHFELRNSFIELY